jgi:imidazole glycerol phosphate synthase subunit HisF
MDAKRIIPVLQVREDLVVEGSSWLGPPAELAGRLEREGADGVIFQAWDGAGLGAWTGSQAGWVRKVAGSLFIPFAVEAAFGGLEDLDALLGAGADQAILPAAAGGASLLVEAALRFGRCHVAAAVAAQAVGAGWRVALGEAEGRDALAWMAELEQRGAGEILLQLAPGVAGAELLFQGAARLALPVLFRFAGPESGWAQALLHGADGVAFPAGLCPAGACKSTLAAHGLSLRG